MRSARFILFLLPLIILSCFKPAQDKTRAEVTTIKAGTLVCSSCVTAVTKAVKAVDGVTDVQVDLNAKTVKVSFEPGRTSVPAIEDAITAAGYDANNKKRDPAAYENLPECCKKIG